MSERLSELLKKADALITRRRSFLAASDKPAAASEDLPVLTDVVTALSSEVAEPIPPDPLSVESLVEQRLQQVLPARVEAQVAERLEQLVPARVAEALTARLAQVLPDKLEEALPARLAEVLPNEVEKALQPRLEAALRLHLAEHLARTQPQMAELLRSWLTLEVPQILSKELYYVADRVAGRLATEFNAGVLPQLDALLTPPEKE